MQEEVFSGLLGGSLPYELELVEVEGKGRGVRVKEKVPKGAYVCEYEGEVYPRKEHAEREREKDCNKESEQPRLESKRVKRKRWKHRGSLMHKRRRLERQQTLSAFRKASKLSRKKASSAKSVSSAVRGRLRHRQTLSSFRKGEGMHSYSGMYIQRIENPSGLAVLHNKDQLFVCCSFVKEGSLWHQEYKSRKAAESQGPGR
jgi:hypothetical protein